jgi:hypothetical protein
VNVYKVYAHEAHAYEVHAHEVPTHEVHTCKVHAYEVHTREVHAYVVEMSALCIGCVFKVSRIVVFYVRAFPQHERRGDTPPIPCQIVALANAAQFSSPALLPRCLTTLLSYRPTTLLPCCLTTPLSYYFTTLLIALWGSRAGLYNDCSQLSTSNLLFSSSTHLP